MVTTLRSLLNAPRQSVEAQDVLAAFLRAARDRWGELVPLEPARYARGVLTIRCPSPLWRAEVVFQETGLKGVLLRELPGIYLRRISAVL